MRSFLRSFRYACNGFWYAFRNERNFRIESVFGLVVIILILLLDFARWEQVALIMMVAWVVTVELLNTVVERVVDIVKPRAHPYLKVVKDLMASVVLVSAFLAVLVGGVILLPHILLFIMGRV